MVLGAILHHRPGHPGCRVGCLPLCSLCIFHCVLEQRDSVYVQWRGVVAGRFPDCTGCGQREPLGSGGGGRRTLHAGPSHAGITWPDQRSAARPGGRDVGCGIPQISGLSHCDWRGDTHRVASHHGRESWIVSATPSLHLAHHGNSPTRSPDHDDSSDDPSFQPHHPPRTAPVLPGRVPDLLPKS